MDQFVTYQETSDIPSTSEPTGEIEEGEANVPNISHATTTANYSSCTTGCPTRYCWTSLIWYRILYNIFTGGPYTVPLLAQGALA